MTEKIEWKPLLSCLDTLTDMMDALIDFAVVHKATMESLRKYLSTCREHEIRAQIEAGTYENAAQTLVVAERIVEELESN
jgi:hypothetical protein